MTDFAAVYHIIDDMVLQLKGFVGQLEQRLTNDVDREFKQLIDSGWKGAGAQAFGGASAQWHATTLEMNQTLTQLHGVLHSTSGDIQATDHSLIGLFG